MVWINPYSQGPRLRDKSIKTHDLIRSYKRNIMMQALYILEIGDEVQSLDLQSLELILASLIDSFFKNAHKNHTSTFKTHN